jgi:thioredoxin 1
MYPTKSMDAKLIHTKLIGSSVPVLVNFGAPWCSLCLAIDPILSGMQSQWGDRISLVNINADEHLELASRHKIRNLPTLLLFVNGRVVERFDNFHSRDDLRMRLERIQVLPIAG